MNCDAAIFAQLDGGRYFKLGLEAQRLALLEVHVLYVRRAHHMQFFFFDLLLKIPGHQVFENVFADLRREPGPDQVRRRLPRPKPRQPDLLLNPRDDALGLAVDLLDRNRNLNFVFATFD